MRKTKKHNRESTILARLGRGVVHATYHDRCTKGLGEGPEYDEHFLFLGTGIPGAENVIYTAHPPYTTICRTFPKPSEAAAAWGRLTIGERRTMHMDHGPWIVLRLRRIRRALRRLITRDA